MKKRFEDWYKVTAAVASGSVRPEPAPLKIRDLSGFRDLEDKLLLYSPARGEMAPALDHAVNELSRKTFGITRNDTWFEFPAGFDDLPEISQERWRIEQLYYDHEDHFDTADATDDEVVATLLARGLDFRDERGHPLSCTLLFCRQAEAAAKGLMGKLPDRQAASLEAWGSRLEEEARRHMARRGEQRR